MRILLSRNRCTDCCRATSDPEDRRRSRRIVFGVQGGYQGAFMVPTEVLAEQHFFAARSLLGDLKVEDQSVVGGERPVARRS